MTKKIEWLEKLKAAGAKWRANKKKAAAKRKLEIEENRRRNLHPL